MNSEGIEDLRRRFFNTVRVCTVAEVDTEEAKIKVDFLGNRSPWIPWTVASAGEVKTWLPPSKGELLVMICPNGEISQAICIGSLYQVSLPAPDSNKDISAIYYPDGATIKYDHKNHFLSVELPKGAKMQINSENTELFGDVLLNGNLKTTGNINTDSNIKAIGNIKSDGEIADKTRTMAGDRAIYNNHTHGNTPPPNNRQ